MRANSTHSAMATRAGVPECSTSDMAVRRSARSIRASPVTGYWGARRVISASIESRYRVTAPTSSRASSAAAGSFSDSARCRSRTASAVCCPKSASKTAESARRRPVRRPRTRSAPDTVDQHGHGTQVEPEQALHGRRDRRPDLGGERPDGLAGAGDDPDPDGDALLLDPDADRAATEQATPRRAAAADPRDARHLQCRQSDELADDRWPDRELVAAHEAIPSAGAAVPPVAAAVAAASPAAAC